MENNLLSSHIDELAAKLQDLLDDYSRMKEELAELRQEKQELEEIVASQRLKLKDFQYQEEISKIVDSVVNGSKSSKELKDRIDIYIKDIDNCISFLNKELWAQM